MSAGIACLDLDSFERALHCLPRSTLRSCIAVSRAWHHSSRRVLTSPLWLAQNSSFTVCRMPTQDMALTNTIYLSQSDSACRFGERIVLKINGIPFTVGASSNVLPGNIALSKLHRNVLGIALTDIVAPSLCSDLIASHNPLRHVTFEVWPLTHRRHRLRVHSASLRKCLCSLEGHVLAPRQELALKVPAELPATNGFYFSLESKPTMLVLRVVFASCAGRLSTLSTEAAFQVAPSASLEIV